MNNNQGTGKRDKREKKIDEWAILSDYAVTTGDAVSSKGFVRTASENM